MAIERAKAVTDSVSDRAKRLDERFPGYQVEVIRRIINIVAQQGQLPNEAQRRKAIREEVSALADLTLQSGEEEGPR